MHRDRRVTVVSAESHYGVRFFAWYRGDTWRRFFLIGSLDWKVLVGPMVGEMFYFREARKRISMVAFLIRVLESCNLKWHSLAVV